MTQFTRFGPSPIPEQPSPESARLLARMRGNRAMQQKINPYGPTGRLFRLLLDAVATRAKPPAGGTAVTVRYPNGARGRLVTGQDADPANGMLLWLHGGGMIAGSPKLEQELAALYASAARIPVFLPHYRMPPKHPFPAAADDVLAAYQALLAEGIPAERLRIAGMSAGGALATGLLGDLGRAGLPLPAAMLLVSPMIQLSAAAARERDARVPDPTSSPAFIERTNKAYAGDTPLTDPRLDYLAADMRDWPPTLVQTGASECIAADAELLGAAMLAAGAACEVQLWPGQVHGFPGVGARSVPEAKAAAEYGQRFLCLVGTGDDGHRPE